MSENGSKRSQERMRDHVQLITSQYRDVCCDMSAMTSAISALICSYSAGSMLRIATCDLALFLKYSLVVWRF